MHEKSKVLLVVLSEKSFESTVGLLNVPNVLLIAFREHENVVTCVTHAVGESNLIRIPVVPKIGLILVENCGIMLPFAKLDLLHICEVVADVSGLVALVLNFLEVSNLHSLESWGDIIAELTDGVNRLLSEGF